MNNNYKKWSNIRDDFQDFILEVLGVKRAVNYFFIDNYSLIQEGQYKIYDLYSNGTNPLCQFNSPTVIWHVPIDWNNSCKIKIVTEYNEDESDVVIENRSINDLIADDWVVIRTLYAADSQTERRYLANIEVKSIEQSIHAYWNNIRNKPTNIEYTTYKLKSTETIDNFATSTIKYPTTKAVYNFVTSSLQSYVPDVSGKEDVSNKVTAWSTEIPEEGANPVITPSNTKYPSEKLVYDTFQLKGNYLTTQDISGKENTSNKVTTWSSTPSDDKYPSEKLVYDTFQPKGNYLTAQDITGKADKSELPTVMGASGNDHKGGLVPDTPSTQGALKYLREDGTWSIPAFEQTVITDETSITLNPNIYYSFGTVTQLTITFANVITGINNEYIFEFDSGSTATTLSIPATVIGINTEAIKANKHYEISIKYDASNQNYYGLIQEW